MNVQRRLRSYSRRPQTLVLQTFVSREGDSVNSDSFYSWSKGSTQPPKNNGEFGVNLRVERDTRSSSGQIRPSGRRHLTQCRCLVCRHFCVPVLDGLNPYRGKLPLFRLWFSPCTSVNEGFDSRSLSPTERLPRVEHRGVDTGHLGVCQQSLCETLYKPFL